MKRDLAARQDEMRERMQQMKKVSAKFQVRARVIRKSRPDYKRNPEKDELLFAAELIECAWVLLYGTTGQEIEKTIMPVVRQLRSAALGNIRWED